MDIDLLIFVEIKKREYKVSKALEKNLIEEGYSVKVKSIFSIGLEMLKYRPKLVLIPYATSEKDKFIKFIKNSYNCEVISLNYEQILNKSNAEFRRPNSDYLKEDIFHISWDQSYTNYLNESGVKGDRILRLPKINLIEYQNSKRIINQYRQDYINEFFLDKYKTVFFYPLNFNWAFKSDSEVREKIEYGYDSNLAWRYRENSNSILNIFLKNLIDKALEDENSFHLVRPHPGVSKSEYIEVINKISEKSIPDNIKISDFGDVFEWVNVADIIVSNWSTVLYDANSLGFKTFQFGSKFFYSELELPIYENVAQIDDLNKIVVNENKTDTLKVDSEILEEYGDLVVRHLKQSNHSSAPKLNGIAIIIYFNIRKIYLATTAALGIENKLNVEKF